MRVNIILLIFSLMIISCNHSKPRRPLNKRSVSELEKTVALNKMLFAKEQEKMKAYMALDSNNVYINSNKGFWYTHIKKNESAAVPVKGDNVIFEQEIVSLNGTILYSKEEIGLRHYFVDKEHVISGLKDGIKLMREGEEVKFLFSSFVAYRMNGDARGIIDSNEPIISTIKLIKINK